MQQNTRPDVFKVCKKWEYLQALGIVLAHLEGYLNTFQCKDMFLSFFTKSLGQ